MNKLEKVFNEQPGVNVNDAQLNPQHKNVFIQLMSMNEEKRAKVIVEILKSNGINSKEQLDNLIKNTKYRR